MKKQIPSFLQSVLWSYPIDALDLKQDKEYIITQILNYGDWQTVKWLRNIYGDKAIKAVIQHPGRGQWFERVFNFWEQIFNIKIDPQARKRAILDVNPDYNYSFKNFNPA